MSDEEKKVIALTIYNELSPRVAFLYALMEKTRERLLKRVEGLSVKDLDYSPHDESIETIGTLLLHIAAVEWSWIFEDMGGQEMDYEKWKHAFALREGIPQLRGKNLKFYLDKLEEVRERVFSRLMAVSDDELDHLVDIGQAVVSIEWILFHLIEHEAMHVGQISVLRRLQNSDV
ncbi:MAG: DinB family protein [Candidatus Hodarchaeota archaeon]